MKRTKEDIQLAELLKKGSHQVEENEWFTPRVLNRLPEKRHTTRWMKVMLYAIVLIGVLGCWMWYSNKVQNANVITVRDLLMQTGMICACITVAGVAAFDFIKSE